MIGTWFSAAAHISGVWPRHASAASMSAPRARSARTAATAPVRAQVSNGASPVGASPGSAPASSSTVTRAGLAFAQASPSGAAPFRLTASGSAPASSRARTISASSR